MSYVAKIVRVGHSSIEEEVEVEVEGETLVCFANVCPYPIVQGHHYPVTLSLWAINGLVLVEANHQPVGIQRIGGDFRYRITGILRGGAIDARIIFEDESFLSEYRYLNGDCVTVDVDRIEIAFEQTDEQ